MGRGVGVSHGMGASLFNYLPLLLTPVGQEQPDPNCLPPGERTYSYKSALNHDCRRPNAEWEQFGVDSTEYRERRTVESSTQARMHTGSPGKFKC